jgi:hypothetical protein
MIDGPDPGFCNLKLAIARAFNASGAANIIARIYGNDDDEEVVTSQPVYFGGLYVPDGILYHRIEDRLRE